MPIKLKKPFSVGDLAPAGAQGFEFVQIVNLYHSGITMDVTLEAQVGTSSGSYYERWQRGENTPTKVINVPPQKVVELWGQKPMDGESIGEAMRRTTYQYILDEGYFEGEIVNNPPLPPEEAKPETSAEPAPEAEAPAAEEPAQSDNAAPEQPAQEATPDAPADSGAEGDSAEEAPAEDAPATEPPAEGEPAAEAPAEGEPTEPVPSPS